MHIRVTSTTRRKDKSIHDEHKRTEKLTIQKDHQIIPFNEGISWLFQNVEHLLSHWPVLEILFKEPANPPERHSQPQAEAQITHIWVKKMHARTHMHTTNKSRKHTHSHASTTLTANEKTITAEKLCVWVRRPQRRARQNRELKTCVATTRKKSPERKTGHTGMHVQEQKRKGEVVAQ